MNILHQLVTLHHDKLRQKVREFAEAEIQPVIRELDASGTFAEDITRKMGKLGLLGINISKEYGGQALDTLSYIIAVEELARIDGSQAATVAAHNSLGLAPIANFGTEAQKQMLLPQLVTGDKLWAFGLTEANAGSDSKGTETRAELIDNKWIINGSKIFITNSSSPLASGITLQAITGEKDGKKELSAILVDRSTTGYYTEAIKNKLVWRTADTGKMRFENCSVPAENLLGERGQGAHIMLNTLDSGRLTIAAMGLGLAQGAYELAMNYAQQRKQFGSPISKFQAIAFKLAEMEMKIELARNYLYHCCWLKDSYLPFGKEAAIAKLYTSEIAKEVADEAVQIHGAYGLTNENAIERFYRDQRILQIGEGTSEILKLVISKKDRIMISGFSKLSKAEKLDWLAKQTGVDLQLLDKLCFTDSALQQTIDEISENVVSNFVLPYSLAPNFVINGVEYAVPMVIEESSVVAAASSAAKFWASHGGFQARVISTGKIGQIHFLWKGEFSDLQSIEYELNMRLLKTTDSLLEKMKGRGGGITKIEWLDFSSQMLNYYQIRLTFETVDAMGANIINSCLEAMAQGLKEYLFDKFPENDECEIVMAILSNHTPDCLVECSVSCPIDALAEVSGDMAACDFARKFETAVRIAQIDPYRAATHNKGIFNGVDAVAMATGNDYRAIEAGGHAFAASSGSYKALTYCEISNSIFTYTLRMPMALGTVGGLTVVHPLAALSLRILQNPSAVQLMQIAASVGLANNFLAIKALITKGIQCGHMRFQLSNILKSLNISDEQAAKVVVYFKDKTVSYRAVEEFLGN